MYRSTTSLMGIRNLTVRLYNKYTALILLLVVMLFVHTSLIQIHPLMFIVWPASAWLTIELYSRWRREPLRVFLFTATFTLYLLATQLLVVENTKGIFFDLDPFPNMATISYYVLGVSAMLFFYDAFVAKTISFRNIPVYVGFASVRARARACRDGYNGSPGRQVPYPRNDGGWISCALFWLARWGWPWYRDKPPVGLFGYNRFHRRDERVPVQRGQGC